MPTTAMTTSAFFAAAMASGDGALLHLGPDQFCMRLAVRAAVGDVERDLAALLQVDATDAR